jgi:spore coat protein CotH
MSNPKGIPLKDEVKDQRTRDDLIELAAIASTVPDGFFVEAATPVLDVERTLTFLAVEAVASHGDAFSYRNNNTYLYRVPATGRFVLIPHGADQSFGATSPMFALSSPYQPTRAILTNRFRSVPALREKYQAEVVRVSQPPVWDEAVLLARVEQIARLLGTAERVGRTASEVARFEASRPIIEAFIRRHGTTWNGSTL